MASALLKIEPADYYRQLALRLRVGEELPLDEVVVHLESIGDERREPVEMVGEYSVRGGILDVFSPESQKPVRIDLFGDQAESTGGSTWNPSAPGRARSCRPSTHVVLRLTTGVDCCGCIIAAVEGCNVELRCNECGAVVGVV